MALNCGQRDPSGDPCGECENCLRIWNGSANLDVVEIDAASNRGVDDARDLRERAMYAASREGHHKVYIVDEAHMLTREAWNALLKILEEPGCRHPVIPVGVLADPLDRLSGLGGDDLAQSLAHLDDLARLDVDVRCWALYAAHRLMQQEACVRQAEAEPLLAGGIDERAGRGHPAGTDHVDRHAGTHKLDDVMDRVTRLDMTSGRIDIDLDRLRGFVDERQYPGHDVACQLVSDLAEHHDLAPFEQA